MFDREGFSQPTGWLMRWLRLSLGLGGYGPVAPSRLNSAACERSVYALRPTPSTDYLPLPIQFLPFTLRHFFHRASSRTEQFSSSHSPYLGLLVGLTSKAGRHIDVGGLRRSFLLMLTDAMGAINSMAEDGVPRPVDFHIHMFLFFSSHRFTAECGQEAEFRNCTEQTGKYLGPVWGPLKNIYGEEHWTGCAMMANFRHSY